MSRINIFREVFCVAVLGWLLSPSLIWAQNNSAGIRAGINFANQSVDPAPGNRSGITSFHAGVYYNFKVGDRFVLQEELLYSRQGFDYEVVPGSTRSIRLDYVNVPILLRFDPNKWLHVEGGGQMGILISGEATYNGTTSSLSAAYTQAIFSWVIGAGVKLPAGLGLSVRYVSDLSDADTFQNVTSKNTTLQISVDWKLFGNID